MSTLNKTLTPKIVPVRSLNESSSIPQEEDISIITKPSGSFKIHPKTHKKDPPVQGIETNSATKLKPFNPNLSTSKETMQRSSKPSFRNSKISEKYNTQMLHFLKLNLKKSDTISALFSCLALLIAWIENDIFFENNNISNSSCNVLRAIVSCLCIIVHYYILRHYKLQLEILKSQRIIYQKTQLHNSNLFKYYLIEILFNYIHCPPYFDFVVPNEQLGIRFDITLDAYISVIMLGRLYVFFRLFDHYTFWTGERATRVCKINGFLPDSSFAIKAYLQYKPYIVLIMCFAFSILLFGIENL